MSFVAGPSRYAALGLRSLRAQSRSLRPQAALPSFVSSRSFRTSTPLYLPRLPLSSRARQEQEGADFDEVVGLKPTKDTKYNKYGRQEPIISSWRPILFSVGFGVAAFSLAAWYTNKDTETWVSKLSGRFGLRTITDRDIWVAKRQELAKEANATLQTLPTALSFLPDIMLVPVLRSYVFLKEMRLNSSPSVAAQVDIIATCAGVFVLWKLRSFTPFLSKWFLHNPIAWTRRQDWRNSFTMLTSTFSHYSLPHLAFNSIALYSFGSAAYMSMMQQPNDQPHLTTSTSTPHYFAFFAVAGVFAGLGSHLVSNLYRLPRLIKTLRSPVQLSPTHALTAHHLLKPSLGASGAIYACLTITALAYPDSSVSIIFIPFFAFPISLGVAGMVALDVVGVIRGWQMFDHVAHLSGAVFGVIYYYFGSEWFYWLRRKLGAEPPRGIRPRLGF